MEELISEIDRDLKDQKFYRIYKNPQIVHSTTQLNNFDVCGSLVISKVPGL